MVGHVPSLQRAMPVLVSTSWMTWIMPASSLFISTTILVSYGKIVRPITHIDVLATPLARHSLVVQQESRSCP